MRYEKDDDEKLLTGSYYLNRNRVAEACLIIELYYVICCLLINGPHL